MKLKNFTYSTTYSALLTAAICLLPLTSGCHYTKNSYKLASNNAHELFEGLPHPTALAATGNKNKAMHHMMLGEIAWDRNLAEEAMHHFVIALRHHPDKSLAARATEVALLKGSEYSFFTATRWAELAPENQSAQVVCLTLLANQGKSTGMQTYLENLYTHHQADITESMILVLSQLQSEQELNLIYQALQTFLASKPETKETQYLLSVSANLANHKQQALDIILALVEKHPLWLDGVILAVEYLQESGKTDASLALTKKLSTENQSNQALQFLYGKLLAEYKYYTAAQEQLSSLVSTEEYGEDVSLYLAMIALEQQRLSDATDYLMNLTSSHNYADAAYYHLGQIADEQKQQAEALNYYEEVSIGPYYLDAQMSIAVIISQQDQLPEALARIHALMLGFPQHKKQLTMTSIYMLVEANEYDNAMVLLNQALEKTPKEIDLLYARSLVAAKLKDIETTESDLLAVLKIEPEHSDALNALGFTLADQTDRFEEALAYIERAFALEPNNPSVIDSMGWVLYRMGNHKEAIVKLRAALSLSQDSEIAAHLGEVLWVSGNQAEASLVWDNALKLTPDHEVLLEAINRLKNSEP